MLRRASFIWTPQQPIDELGFGRSFFGAEIRRDDGRNRWFLFRREFELPAPPRTAPLRVFADGRYQLFANGARVGRGPARADPYHARFDGYDLAPWLRAGRNALAVLVHVYGVDTAWYEPAKGFWQLVFGDGGLWVEGDASCGGEPLRLDSDASWRCREAEAWNRETPRINFGLGFAEDVDGNRLPAGWTEPGFDDSAWDTARRMFVGTGEPDARFSGLTVEPFPTLLPREIPPQRESELLPARIVWAKGLEPQPALAADRRPWQEPLCNLPAGSIDDTTALLTGGARTATLRTRDGCDVAVLLDFGRIHAGYPFVELEAQGGEVVELCVAEGMRGEWDGAQLDSLRPSRASAHGAQWCRYVARPGVQRFERFEWAGFRWLQLVVRNAPSGLRVRRVGSTWTRYAAEPRGAFRCSDPELTRLWQLGRYTLECCMHDGWIDCPGREQRQWLGDATVEFLVSQAAFGPSANALNRQYLLHAAESQRSDGLTQMFAPGDHKGHGLLIPDWTLQWIINAELHARYTGDLDTIEEIFPSLEKALAWFERHVDAHGLVANQPFWHFHDWAALGRRGEAATLNALLVGALRGTARLARALGRPGPAERFEARAARISRALDARHWDARRGAYVDCVDPASGAQEPRMSQHGNAAAILWDVAPRERWARIVARVADRERLVFTAAPPTVPTGGTFDLEESVVLANTFFAHFVCSALAKAGRFDLALASIRERFGPMLARQATTLWESYDPTASLCHGFSATPTFQLSSEVLGVSPLADGFARFRVAPQPVDLEWAEGVFPTVRGDVRVAWRREAAALALDVDVPAGAEAEVVSPAGYAPSGAARLAPGSHSLRLPSTPE